jgi:hypothetical protein
MNDTRRKEIQRAQMLIGEAKGILEVAATQERDDFDKMPQDLQNDDAGERAEEAVDTLELAAMCCDEAMAECPQRRQHHARCAAGAQDDRRRADRHDLSRHPSRSARCHCPPREGRDRRSRRLLFPRCTALRDVSNSICLAEQCRRHRYRPSPRRRARRLLHFRGSVTCREAHLHGGTQICCNSGNARVPQQNWSSVLVGQACTSSLTTACASSALVIANISTPPSGYALSRPHAARAAEDDRAHARRDRRREARPSAYILRPPP